MSAQLELMIADLLTLVDADRQNLDHQLLTDDHVAELMTALVRLYAARCDARAAFPSPLKREKVTATDVLAVICEMIRVVDVNMFEVSMWHSRQRPKD